MIAQTIVGSPVGDLCLLASEHGLVGLDFGAGPAPGISSPSLAGAGLGPRPSSGDAERVLCAAAAWLEAYLDGAPREVDFPLALEGSPFQRAVWGALREIPLGRARTYGEVARALGRPGAARAVGAACGQNPIAIVVPCHRVIGKDGTLTGFGGGLEAKRWLLAHEARVSRRADAARAAALPASS